MWFDDNSAGKRGGKGTGAKGGPVGGGGQGGKSQGRGTKGAKGKGNRQPLPKCFCCNPMCPEFQKKGFCLLGKNIPRNCKFCHSQFILPPGYNFGGQPYSRQGGGAQAQRADDGQEVGAAFVRPAAKAAAKPNVPPPTVQDEAWEFMLSQMPPEMLEEATQKAIAAGYKPPKKTDAREEAWSQCKEAEKEALRLDTLLRQQLDKYSRLVGEAEESQAKILELQLLKEQQDIKVSELRSSAIHELMDPQEVERKRQRDEQEAEAIEGLQQFTDLYGIPPEGYDHLISLFRIAQQSAIDQGSPTALEVDQEGSPDDFTPIHFGPNLHSDLDQHTFDVGAHETITITQTPIPEDTILATGGFGPASSSKVRGSPLGEVQTPINPAGIVVANQTVDLEATNSRFNALQHFRND